MGEWSMGIVIKQGVAVLIKRAHRSGTTGTNGYRRQEKSFPQGEGKSAMLGQENPTM
jgi:hypothetical protein